MVIYDTTGRQVVLETLQQRGVLSPNPFFIAEGSGASILGPR